MKTPLKQIVSLFLCAVMIAGTVCLMPSQQLSANAEEASPRGATVTYDISKNSYSHVTATYDPTNYTLRITGTGEMKDFEVCGDPGCAPWCVVTDSIMTSPVRTVSIFSGVMNIGANAFGFCTNLTTVTMASSVESVRDLPKRRGRAMK